MTTHAPFDGLSLPELFRRSVDQYADKPAVIFNHCTTDYATLDQQSDHIAAFLAEQEIRKGDRIGLYSINSDTFAAAYLGIIKAGAVVVPVNVLLSADALTHIFNDAAIRALVFHPLFSASVAELRNRITGLEFCLGMIAEHEAHADWQWQDALASTAEVPQPRFEPDEDLAAIIYTSGTTGKPKGAMLSHRNLAANTWSVKEALKLRSGEDRILLVLPMFHSFAGTVGMLMPLFYGCAMIVMPKFDPQQVADTIESEQATMFLGVPTMYNYLLRLPESANGKFSSLRLCISGGAAMPAAVMQQFEQRFNQAIYEGDGPTECSPVTCVNPLEGERKAGSVGVPVPMVEMCIMDSEGNERPIGETGEICVRGPNVMKGYWNLPDATREVFFGEWLRTGDLGHEDKDGYFYIVDRLKDMVIYNGINVYPRMVEEVMYQLPVIEEVAVIGEPHEVHGEIPVAYVALKKEQSISAEEIIAWCNGRMGRHEIPRKIYFVEELPKNATGKILKRALRVQGERERGIGTQSMAAAHTQRPS